MVTEGIDYAADAPAVFFGDRIDFLCARFDSPCEYGVRIVDRQNDANRDASERFGAEVVMLWRFIAEPKLGAIDRQPGDDTFVVSHAKYFQGAECSLVEIDGAGAAANAEPGSNRGGGAILPVSLWIELERLDSSARAGQVSYSSSFWA